MNCHLYGGVPIEQVDFEKEFDKERDILEKHIAELKARKKAKDIRNKNYQYWTIKLNRANKALEEIQQYRAIGTVDELKALRKEVELYRNLDKTNFSDGYNRAG